MTTITRTTGRFGAFLTGPPLYQPMSPWGPLAALAATAFAFVASVLPLVAGLAAAGLLGVSDAELNRALGPELSIATPLGVAMVVSTQIAELAAIWLLAGRKSMRPEVLRLNPPQPGWGLCLLASVVLIVASGLLESLLQAVLGFDQFADGKWLTDGLLSPVWWGAVIIAVVLAPLGEELTFRGFLLSALAQTRLGFWGGALVSNTLWTLLHWGYSYPGLASVFAAGLMLTWLVRRTGAMRPAVVAHAVVNASSLAFTYAFAPVTV